jgi:hypothetical protein
MVKLTLRPCQNVRQNDTGNHYEGRKTRTTIQIMQNRIVRVLLSSA